MKHGSGKGSTAKRRARRSRAFQRELRERRQATGPKYTEPGEGRDGEARGQDRRQA